MKKVLFLIIFITSFTLMNAQSWRFKACTIDSGSTLTSAFKIDQNYWLKSAWFPTMVSGTDSVYLMVSNDGTTFDTLRYDNDNYLLILSGTQCAVSYEANITAGWEWFKYLFTDEQDTTYTITNSEMKSQ